MRAHLLEDPAGTATIRGIVARFYAERPTEIARAIELLGPAARVRAPARLHEVAAAHASGRTFAALLGDAAAVVLGGVFDSEEVDAWAATIRAHPEAQDPLGRTGLRYVGSAWYAYVDRYPKNAEDRWRRYHASAVRTDAVIDRLVPGLRVRLLRLCASVVGEPVHQREGWAGPGFVIFPAELGGQPGDIHFDWEGLAAAPPGHLGVEAYTGIAMVQRPERGGGLRVWGITVDVPGTNGGRLEAAGSGAVVDYRIGDLVLIDGHDLHQIIEYSGMRDRICLTFHVARLREGWRVWL